MSFDFPLILFMLTVLSGVIALVDWILRRMRSKKNLPALYTEPPIAIEYARAFFPVLLIVFCIRSFIIQPYRVPTGSLEPTVMAGDFILVNQFQYGLKFPVWNQTLIPVSHPKRGQIALFHYPVNKAVTFVKRVIGLPGDHISYINKILYINGKKMPQKFIRDGLDVPDGDIPVKIYQEDLDGVKHLIYRRADVPARNFYNLVVPKGEYLMMGDNRDNSDDSLYWGFVPAKNFIGEAFLVWMSWNSYTPNWSDKIRWHRIGTVL